MTYPLRYPDAQFIPAYVGNHGPRSMIGADIRRIVVHIAQGGTINGLIAWFKDPKAKVSSHFAIAQDGEVVQFVELDTVAWAEAAYNETSISIEHVGFTGHQLTGPQLAASLKLIRWLSHEFDVPAKRTASPDIPGVIGHGELGVLGGNHPDCPGAPILSQLTHVLSADQPPHTLDPPTKETAVKLPFTVAQLKVFVAEAGALFVYVNDFVKADHITGTPLIWLNAAAAIVTAVSHSVNKVAAKKTT
jgi:hypothetical protein